MSVIHKEFCLQQQHPKESFSFIWDLPTTSQSIEMTPPPYAGHPWGEKKRGVREIKKETDRETAREADYEREKKRDRL